MAYATVKANILTHAAAAGAALTVPILDAQAGYPVPKGRCIRVWYAGETAPVRMGDSPRVLNGELVAHRTNVAVFFPVSVSDEAVVAAIDADLFSFGDELRTRILGDSQLGGASTDLEVGYLEPDLVTYNNTRYLIGVVEITSDFTEYTLAP